MTEAGSLGGSIRRFEFKSFLHLLARPGLNRHESSSQLNKALLIWRCDADRAAARTDGAAVGPWRLLCQIRVMGRTVKLDRETLDIASRLPSPEPPNLPALTIDYRSSVSSSIPVMTP